MIFSTVRSLDSTNFVRLPSELVLPSERNIENIMKQLLDFIIIRILKGGSALSGYFYIRFRDINLGTVKLRGVGSNGI